ncbi:MAG: hypothetical protein ACRERD_07345 [Candidatus Binatia bacterium]
MKNPFLIGTKIYLRPLERESASRVRAFCAGITMPRDVIGT